MKNPTKEDFEKAIRLHVEGTSIGTVKHQKEAAAACYELAKQMQPKWIPVHKELPKNQEEVLAFSTFKRISQQSWCAHTDQDEQWFQLNFTHWQPLPESPTI